ncbi:MAG: flavin reductase family protein [Gemmataceae bacterium]
MTSSAASSIFRRLDPPIWLLTTKSQEGEAGLIATFVNQGSISVRHPRVLVGLAKQHNTSRYVEDARQFVLHLLSEDNVDVVAHFGLKTGKQLNKMTKRLWERTPNGLPLLPNSLGWLECHVETTLDTGDRTLYLAAVQHGELLGEAPLLTLQSWLELASEDEKREAKRLMERDQQIDAMAIEKWRERYLL